MYHLWPRQRPWPRTDRWPHTEAAQRCRALTTGLSNKADQSAFDVLEGVVATKSTMDGVDLKLSNYSTTAAMNGPIALANNATTAALDIAARITPLEVDTKVANALLRAVTAAVLASELASRDTSISGLQAFKADASALTAFAGRRHFLRGGL